jgi:integrase
MVRTDVLRMVKRLSLAAGLPSSTCCHTFHATGITAYLENGGTLENAAMIAAHKSPRTTKLYDRTGALAAGLPSSTCCHTFRADRKNSFLPLSRLSVHRPDS